MVLNNQIETGVDQVTISGSGLATGDVLTNISVSTETSLNIATENGQINTADAVIKNNNGNGDTVTGNYEIT